MRHACEEGSSITTSPSLSLLINTTFEFSILQRMEAETINYIVLLTTILDFLSTVGLALLGGYCVIRCCKGCFEFTHDEHESTAPPPRDSIRPVRSGGFSENGSGGVSDADKNTRYSPHDADTREIELVVTTC